MKITVNGKEFLLERSITIAELIEIINCDITKVAIEKNAVILLRSEYHKVKIEEGDIIECVEFVGGG